VQELALVGIYRNSTDYKFNQNCLILFYYTCFLVLAHF
jgi:hypothetical protein